MLITIEDQSKVETVKKLALDNNIKINWEKANNDGWWMEVKGETTSVNKLYDQVVKINRKKANFLTKIKNNILKKFEEFNPKNK